MRLITFLLFTFISLLLPIAAQAVTATTDRALIYEGETFVLTITLDDDGTDSAPDFTPLEQNFTVLNTGRSSQISIMNGQRSSQLQWQVALAPKHTGILSIPSITLGTQHTPALAIEVLDLQAAQTGARAPDVFMKAEITPKNPYVQAQVLYTLKIYHALSLQNASLTALEIDNALIEKLGDDVAYEEQRDGKIYRVIARRYAVFPQASGELAIPSLTLQARLVDVNTTTRLFSTGRRVHLATDPATLNVQPRATTAHRYWLPAEEVSISESWVREEGEVEVGQPITRVITLTAKGLSSIQLPDIALGTPADIRSYPDQATLNDTVSEEGIIGSRQEKVALVPTSEGEFIFPEIEIPWWDTNTNTEKIATLPAYTMTVLPSAASIAATPDATLPADTDMALTPPFQTRQDDTLADTSTHTLLKNNMWVALSIVFALLWLATLLLWWRSHKRQHTVVGHPVNTPANVGLKQAKHALQQACKNNQAHQTQAALLAWGHAIWPAETLTNLGQLCALLKEDDLKQQIEQLNQALYGQAGRQDWQGSRALWSAIKRYKVDLPKQRHSNNGLAKLHPL